MNEGPAADATSAAGTGEAPGLSLPPRQPAPTRHVLRPGPVVLAEADSYVRVRAPGSALLQGPPPTRRRPVVFVDLDCAEDDAAPERLRAAAPAMFMGADVVLARAPVGAGDDAARALAAALRQVCQEMGLAGVSTGVLRAAAGVPHRIVWDGPPSALGDDRVLRRARACELEALLTLGRGVWQPDGFHYRLPNGQHSDVFVRLQDAVQEARDGVALASWLAPALRNGLGLVLDSPSLVHLVLGLEVIAARAGITLGPVAALDGAPTRAKDAGRAVRDAGRPGKGLLALLSVNSGGGTRQDLRAALRDYGTGPRALHTLADRTQHAFEVVDAHPAALWPTGRLDVRDDDTWLGLARYGSATKDRDCATCRTPDRARTVPVDPRTLDPTSLAHADLVVPDVMDAARNQRLWELADRRSAVLLQGRPDPHTQARRPKAGNSPPHMAVKVDWKAMLDPDDQSGTDVVADIAGLLAERLGKDAPAEVDLRPCDLLVVDDADVRRPGADALMGAVADVLGGPDLLSVDTSAGLAPRELAAEERGRLVAAERVVVFALGAVTGLTLQRLLVTVQEARRDAGGYHLAGLVLHTRLETHREWETLRNSFGRRLHALFDTLLPATGPLDDEDELLGELDEPDAPQLAAFLDARRDLCAGRTARPDPDDPTYTPALWGMGPTAENRTRVRPQSVYGDRLGPAALLAAVGASVHRVRSHAASGPAWTLFELPAITRSYYDPLILACVLRWLAPHEIWWGHRDRDAERVLSDVVARATDEDLKVLLPELLLAAHLGKIPPRALAPLRAASDTVLASGMANGWTQGDLLPVRAACWLLDEG